MAKQYEFKVTLSGDRRIWRRIAMRGDQTLDDLHEAVFCAFDRFDPHLYSFYFPRAPHGPRMRMRPFKEYCAPFVLEDPGPFGREGKRNAAKARIDRLELHVGRTFEYLFDYGDCWLHEVCLESVAEAGAGERLPRILEIHGVSPPQYRR